jgi:purine-binding chemotaxis protein CheW
MISSRSDPSFSKTNSSASNDAGNKTSFFTIFVDESAFGLEVKEAQTIFRAEAITPIPLSRPEIVGLVNLRGRVVVAVSLRRRLGVDTNSGRENIAIGIEKHGEQFALLVDRIGDVLALSEGAKAELPPHCEETRARFTQSLYAVESKLFPILDVERLFDFSF